jgi:hypothetical protein
MLIFIHKGKIINQPGMLPVIIIAVLQRLRSMLLSAIFMKKMTKAPLELQFSAVNKVNQTDIRILIICVISAGNNAYISKRSTWCHPRSSLHHGTRDGSCFGFRAL